MVSAKTMFDELKFGEGQGCYFHYYSILKITQVMLKQRRGMVLLTLTLCANIERDLFN